jgi:hypothetical protein
MTEGIDPAPAALARRDHLPLATPTGPVSCGAQSAEGRERRALQLLRRLYVFRVASSVIWVMVIVSLGSSVGPHSSITLIAAALAVYPGLDGLATLVDLRILSSASVRRLLWCNQAAGFTAAALILVLSGSVDSKIRLFGLWAIASGGIQLTLGASRQAWLKRQWLMIISGGGSVVAGLTYASWVGSGSAGLSALEQYSLGGAAWYLITAGWFLASGRSGSPRKRSGAWLARRPGPQE